MAEPDYPTFEVSVEDDGIRPKGEPDECFFCRQKVGQLHIKDCVITWRHKKIKLIALVEFKQKREQLIEEYNRKEQHGI